MKPVSYTHLDVYKRQDDGGSVGIAVTVFHQDFAFVPGVPKTVPTAGFVGGDEVAVVEDAGSKPFLSVCTESIFWF